MLSDRVLSRLSAGLRRASADDELRDLDPPTEAGVALDGEVLAGRFRLIETIAAGGMGVVHRALDLQTGEEVAVKIPNLSSPQNDRRFQIECEALTAVVAPSVVRVLGQGNEETPFLAMELVRGDTLAQRIREGGGLSPDTAVRAARRVAAALAMVHAAGWVHRDVKPANVTVTEDGDVRLVDFGLARAVDGPGCGTAPGHLVGTLSYIAPEQLTGTESADARADVFALGCVLYECLLGRVAFRRLTSEVAQGLWSIARHPLLDPASEGAPRAVSDVIQRFTDPSPDGRPDDGLSALAELCAIDAEMGPVLRAAGGATASVRAAALGALRTPVVLTGAPGSGRARTAVAAATLLAEMLAPCRAVVLRSNPRTSRVPGGHAAVLERLLRDAGFRNAARALDGAEAVERDRLDPSAVVVLLDANFCDAVSLERLSAAATAGFLRVIATARAGAEVPPSFLVIAQPDGLPAEDIAVSPFESWTMRAGAMFGTVFAIEGAASLIGGPEAKRVGEACRRLVDRGVLRATRDGRFAFARSNDWYAALRALSPRDVRLGVQLVERFERASPPGPPEAYWHRSAVEPAL